MKGYYKLKEILNYDRESGLFTWKIKSRKGVQIGDIAGAIRPDGYIVIGYKKEQYLAHRLALMFEYDIDSEQVDHINGNKSDNRISNLREVNALENSKNKKIDSRNKSGVSGVSFHRNRWRARIGVDGKDIPLGYFSKFSDAVDARKNAEVLYGFHKNHGRIK